MDEKCIGTLKFYDAEDMKIAIDGWKWRQVVAELDEYLRKKIKYGEHSEEIYQSIRDRLPPTEEW